MNNQGYLNFALFAARSFGPLFKKNFGRAKNVKSKGGDPRNLVTEIDQAIETRFRGLIAKKFPAHKVIGEEFGRDNFGPKDYVWIIDPVDGTTNYVQGIPLCCISIALWHGDKPIAGVVYNPILKLMFKAAAGGGAFLNNKPITASKKLRLDQAFGGFGWGRNIKKAQVNFPKLVNILYKIRTLGSSAWETCLVASGVYDFQIQNEINIWDVAAGAVIVSEAGGIVSQPDGKPLSTSTQSIISSNGLLHRQLIKELKKAQIF